MNLRLTFLSLTGCVLVAAAASAQQVPSVAKIESPRPGQRVASREHVTIKMLGPGFPIVAVRSMQEGSKWWIQEMPKARGSSTFVVPARFGNDKTRPGTGFVVTAFVVSDANAGGSIQPGSQLESLPEKFAHLEKIEVVAGENPSTERALPWQAEMISPLPGSTVVRIQDVTFKLPMASAEKAWLVVRADEEKNCWYVQESLQQTGPGQFRGRARIGSLATPSGSKFLMMLIQPKDEAARAALKTGAVLRDLGDFRCSPSFPVITGTSQAAPQQPGASALSAR